MSRTYVVTGTASGIAAATARILKERGNKVIGIDVHDADIVADLGTKQGRLDAANKAIELSGGTINAVICCAGLSAPIPLTASVNYFGMTELLGALAPTLAKAEAPRAVLISSLASIMDNDKALVEAMCVDDDEEKAVARAMEMVEIGGGYEQMIYASSKRAISRWCRREAPKAQWAGAGIPLNAIAPGIVRTPMMAGLLAVATEAMDAMMPMPLNYHLEPENVAYLLIWLASPENTHICGQTIYIDGGADTLMRGDNIWG